MHEYNATQHLLQLALEQADLRDGEQIERLHIVLDPNGGYTPDAIRFYFEQLSQGTGAAGADLAFRLTPHPQQIQLLSIDVGDGPVVQTEPIAS